MAKAKSSRRTTTAAGSKAARPARAAAKKPAAAKKAPARDIEALARRAIKDGLGSESYRALVALASTNLKAMAANPVGYSVEMSGTESHIALLCKGSTSQKLVSADLERIESDVVRLMRDLRDGLRPKSSSKPTPRKTAAKTATAATPRRRAPRAS